MEIEKAVEESDIVIVSLSTHSVDKEGYVQRELRYVLNIADEKPEGSIFVIPLRLDDCVIPRRLRGWQWVNYFPEDQKQYAYQRLLESLKLRAARPGISTHEPAEFRSIPVGIPQDKQEREKKIEKVNSTPQKKDAPNLNKRHIAGMITSGLLILSLCIWAAWKFLPYLPILFPEPTDAFKPTITVVSQPEQTDTPSLAETSVPSTPTLGIGSIMIGKDGMTLLYVPAGEFKMGSDADDALAECQKFVSDCKRESFANEEPPHTVALDAFWIDQTEVTNAMYAKCVDAGVCVEPASSTSYTRDSYYGNPEFDNYPVIYVSVDNARVYCKWANRRLPTEAEWEKAARGENCFVYPWGNDFDGTRANFCDKSCSFDSANKSFDDGYADTAPVGSYLNGASPYGALDMAGNVLEWVSSLYKPYPYDATDGRENFGSSGVRLVRGGDWASPGYYLRSALRVISSRFYSSDIIGFRCARST